MSRRATTQVGLIDGTTVSVPEPGWCVGQHEDGLHLVDLMHESAETALTIQTTLGRVEILQAGLTQYPYSTREADRQTHVAVLLTNGYERFDPSGLHALADSLTERAVQLRVLARELAELRHQQ